MISKSFTLYQNVIYNYTLGRPSEGNGRPKQLQYATMPVISDIKCVKPHAYWNKTMITSNMICAQGFNIPLNFNSIPTLMAQYEIFLLIFKPQKTFQKNGNMVQITASMLCSQIHFKSWGSSLEFCHQTYWFQIL